MDIKFWEHCEVQLVAQTSITKQLHEYLSTHDLLLPSEMQNPISLIEVAGRHCYMSFGNKAHRKSTEEYISNLIKEKHFSVLEHVSCTFVIRGISRFCTHELVRHRHFSFSQFSTRYCDPLGFVIPYEIKHKPDDTPETKQLKSKLQEQFKGFCRMCVSHYNSVLETLSDIVYGDKLLKRKYARGSARFFLSDAVESPIVVSGNLRAWREMLEKRTTKYRQPSGIFINQSAASKKVLKMKVKMYTPFAPTKKDKEVIEYLQNLEIRLKKWWTNGRKVEILIKTNWTNNPHIITIEGDKYSLLNYRKVKKLIEYLESEGIQITIEKNFWED